jgi:hypothetical protein
MRIHPIAVGLGVLVAAVTLGADDLRSILWEDAGPFKHVDDSPAYRFSRQLLLHQRNHVRSMAAPSAASQDVGDVAVVADNGSILIPAAAARPFDLALPTSIVWTPTGGGFGVAFAAASLDSNVGATLPLGDDDSENVLLPFSFPFLGSSYSGVFVNSDGNITLGSGDSESTPRDAARLIGGPPRIAPLLNDLNPETAGQVTARVDADRAVITWTEVPEFGTTNANTFQVTLQSNGTITFAYSRIETAFGAMVIGVAEGNNEGPLNEIDLTASLPGAFDAGAIFEEFAPAHGTEVDILELSQEFYRTHSDLYDFLVVFTDFTVDLGNAFAFNAGIKNQTSGLGLPLYDFTPFTGSGGELESFVMMNRIGLYWPDEDKLVDPPIKKFRFFGGASVLGPPGSDQITRRARWFGTLNGDFGAHGSYTLGLNSAMSIMGQEAGHRWLAFVPFVHPTKGIAPDSFDLLGRSFAHWSFFFNVRVPSTQFTGDPRASSAEGNAIVDFGGNVFGDCVNPGETRFRTERNELIDGYTALDQYLMGLRQSSEVGLFWYVDEPARPISGTSFEDVRSVAAIDDVGVCGKRVNLTVANVQAFPGVGPRVPAIGDEIDQDADGQPRTDVKTMAFILLVQQGSPMSPAHASAINQVDNFRRTWQLYANGPATGGRGRFDANLNPGIH